MNTNPNACPRCLTGMVVRTTDVASPVRCVNCGACGTFIRPRTAQEIAALSVINPLPLEYRVGQRLDQNEMRNLVSLRSGNHASV